MVIAALQPNEVVAACRRTLGLPPTTGEVIDETLLAALARRSAGINCPCSPATLRRSLVDSLRHLSSDGVHLQEAIEDTIEKLVLVGDLLDLTDMTTTDPAVNGSWLFMAPPSFVLRPNGAAILLGVVPDQDSFLPQSLVDRVTYDGAIRKIAPQSDENLSELLREEGLLSLSEAIWSKAPRQRPAQEVLRFLDHRLAEQPLCGVVSDLQILDAAKPVTFYKGRWRMPKSDTGAFVGRRPQEFGAPIWCYVELDCGTPLRLMDLPVERTRWRSCDAAWHAQMAIDALRGSPQTYRRSIVDDRARLDFFSPLPAWAERRLLVLGTSAPRDKCLFSYWLPLAELEAEEKFLQGNLWLKAIEANKGSHANH